MAVTRPRVVVSGFIGLLPAGGVTWDYIQYPLGFHDLGCDVLYLEDTRQWPVYQAATQSIDCLANVAYLETVMAQFGLAGRWAYRDAISGRVFGLGEDALREFCRTADVFINVSCSTPLREEYAAIPVRILVDSDPVFTQVQYLTARGLYGQASSLPTMVAQHTHLFTFGESIGHPGCAIPDAGLLWRPTRQPIVLRQWANIDASPAAAPYSTVMNWSAAKPFAYDGRLWGQKDVEFEKVMALPGMVPRIPLLVALGQTGGPPVVVERLRGHGWDVVDANAAIGTPAAYRAFIEASRGELSVAKHTYVQGNTGWFSGRSACYLAAGRPVVTQDTGWSAHVPPSDGLFPFTDVEQAAAALNRIEREPRRHAAGARRIAGEAFDSALILPQLMRDAGAW